MKILFSFLLTFFGSYNSVRPLCDTCNQDGRYNCAANTLSMNYRLCMDMTEVSGRMYKVFLLDIKKEKGESSEAYQNLLPNWQVWSEIYPKLSASKIESQFFETSEFALAPMIGISYQQAVAFSEWRTTAFKKELAKMDADERAEFPKDFVFRLPTPAEWGRMRFMSQDKRMLKQIDKIAESYNKEYDLKKSKVLSSDAKVQSVFLGMDESLGLFHLHDNVSEMTAEEGIAMGGSWKMKNQDFQKEIEYSAPQAWLGFRCIFEILE